MIRRYEPRDFEDVLYLQQICYLKPCTRDELREKLQGQAWVACDEEVIGAVICSELNGTLHIWSLTVAPGCRNQGIGGKLLATVEDLGKELSLYVDTENPAKYLYLKRGYRTRQIIKDHYGAGYDGIEMRKQL